MDLCVNNKLETIECSLVDMLVQLYHIKPICAVIVLPHNSTVQNLEAHNVLLNTIQDAQISLDHHHW